jgi:hypothetical protein
MPISLEESNCHDASNRGLETDGRMEEELGIERL